MQQPVHARESTAPQLDQAAPWQPTINPEYRASPAGTRSAQDRPRTPLAVVPAPSRASGRGFVALCVGILVVALLAVLVVNISVSNRQYEMVGLKGEQLDLTQSNERLRQQVEHLEAPQNLAAEADKLGMVRPGDIAAIDLATGQVSGAATSAEGEDRTPGLVAAPAGPADRAAASDGEGESSGTSEGSAPVAQDAADAKASEQTADVPAGADAADTAVDQPGGSAEDGADAEDSHRDLNGGTIPAPQFVARGTD
jgi:hypothetical protein